MDEPFSALDPQTKADMQLLMTPDLAGGKAELLFCHTRYRGGSLFIQ